MYTKGKNDECYTLPYGVEPIIKYIPKDAVVWCPFDKENSEFVQQIVANGNKVVCSHIDNGQDFYSFEPDEHWDVIVSNPPFTGKKKIFERALDLGRPFALICSATWFNDAAPVQIFLTVLLTIKSILKACICAAIFFLVKSFWNTWMCLKHRRMLHNFSFLLNLAIILVTDKGG